MIMHQPSLWAKLPDFLHWREADASRTLSDYLYAKGTVDLAVAFADLFWPSVQYVQGCYLRVEVLRKGTLIIKEDSSFQERQSIEQTMNRLYIYELFEHEHPDTKLEAEEYIATLIQEMWSSALAKQYPDVQFSFAYATEPTSYGPTITFWQQEESAR